MDSSRIQDVLCCPKCKREIVFLPIVVACDSALKEGVMKCAFCNSMVGAVENFKFDFLHFKQDIDLEGVESQIRNSELPKKQPYTNAVEIIDYSDERIQYIGDWHAIDDKYMCCNGYGTDNKVVLELDLELGELDICLLTHPWSGKALIKVDNDVFFDLDLFRDDGSIIEHYPIRNQTAGRHRIEIIPLGQRHEKAQGTQVLIDKFVLRKPEMVPLKFERKAVNNGNPFPERFLKLLDVAPANGLVLDCGGGMRQLDDDRYINIEYSRYEEPDIFGDVLALPFKSDSFDVVLSQAVMEHVCDPFKAAAEIYRVLKPGGILYAEAAFMQPLHGAPYHFFNLTVNGIEEVFKNFRMIESGWFGPLSFTLDNMIRSASVVLQMGEAEYNGIYEILKGLDSYVSEDHLKHVASTVFFHGTKGL